MADLALRTGPGIPRPGSGPPVLLDVLHLPAGHPYAA